MNQNGEIDLAFLIEQFQINLDIQNCAEKKNCLKIYVKIPSSYL